MSQEIIKFIKKYPLLLHFAKFFYRLSSSFKLPIYILFDPTSIKTKWYRKIKKMQLNKNKPLFLDRQGEIKEFFNVNNLYLLKHYIKYGFPNSDRFKQHYLQAFKDSTGPNELKKAYDNISFDYTLRLMLTYERYSMITGYLDFMIKDSGKNSGIERKTIKIKNSFRQRQYANGIKPERQGNDTEKTAHKKKRLIYGTKRDYPAEIKQKKNNRAAD